MLNEDSPNSSADSQQNFTVDAKEAHLLQPRNMALTLVICAAGWAIPGFGHVLLGRWVRGAILFGCVVLMFVIGLGMQGELYKVNPIENLKNNPFHVLGVFANSGVGLPYVLATRSGFGTGVMTAQTFDYGWAFLVVCGLLNYLVILDAFDIAQGRKP